VLKIRIRHQDLLRFWFCVCVASSLPLLLLLLLLLSSPAGWLF
jgi:hypothetical protein